MPDDKSCFFRFYNLPSEKLNECVEKLKQMAKKGLVRVTRKKLTKSVNLFAPTGKNIEILFHFDSHENLMAFWSNPQVMGTYRKYAVTELGAEAIERHIGDPAFAS
jgi:hypothetical protein